MNSILYRVNRKGQFKDYVKGSFNQVQQASDDLRSRAANKGYKMICRSVGNAGVILTYSDGNTRVEIAYTSTENEKVMLSHLYK
jgi:hypothetical protein